MKKHLSDDLTILIPLYRSRRFLPVLIGNIEEHLRCGARLLISDQHGADDTASVLQARYGHLPHVTIRTDDSRGDWVDHLNLLIGQAPTKYARILPHDDTALPGSSSRLVAALRRRPDSMVATGRVLPVDVDGRPYRPASGRKVRLAPQTFLHAMSFHWKGLYEGAFKGVFDAAAVRERDLYIRKTPGLVNADRLWLAALFLAGGFEWVPRPMLLKRYHAGSAHQAWGMTPDLPLAHARVLCDYYRALIPDPDLLSEARFITWHYAVRRARDLSARTDRNQPPFGALPARPEP